MDRFTPEQNQLAGFLRATGYFGSSNSGDPRNYSLAWLQRGAYIGAVDLLTEDIDRPIRPMAMRLRLLQQLMVLTAAAGFTLDPEPPSLE